MPLHTAPGNNVTQTSYNIFGCSMQSGMKLQPIALAYGTWKQCHANKLQHIWLQHAVGDEATTHCFGWKQCHTNKLQHIWLQHAVGDEAASHCLGIRHLETMSRKQATLYLVAACSRG